MKQHIEFDIEHDGAMEWNHYFGDEILSMRSGDQWHGYRLVIPMGAVITTVYDALKPGDVLDSVSYGDVLADTPTKTIVTDSDGDAWQREPDATWMVVGVSDERRPSADLIHTYGPITVVQLGNG